METLFIKKLANEELFNKLPSVVLDDLFCFSDTNNTNEKQLTFINNDSNNKEEYEYIINIENIDNTNLTDEEEKEKNNYIAMINEENTKINTIITYLINNCYLNKVTIPYYKVYDYSNTPNNLRRKIKTHNHIFDIKKFILKNKITSIDTNYIKNMSNFILTKSIELLYNYNKCLLYSLQILKEHSYLIRHKNDYLVSIIPTFFTIINDEITINHYNKIKNTYNKNDNKYSTIINIAKNKNNIYEITFK